MKVNKQKTKLKLNLKYVEDNNQNKLKPKITSFVYVQNMLILFILIRRKVYLEKSLRHIFEI